MPERIVLALVAIVSIVLLGASMYFFLVSLSLMMRFDVTSSLLAALIGFTTLSASISVIKSWIIARAFRKQEEEAR